MTLSDHHELISTVTELKSLLNTLAAVDLDNTLILPSTETGVHLPDVFDVNAAMAAGFSAEAVLVLSALPYFDASVRLGHSVSELVYIGCDQGAIESCREALGRDAMMPPEALYLTLSEGGYGIQYVYDTEEKVIYPWAPVLNTPPTEDEDKSIGQGELYKYVAPKSPREALQPVIDRFRKLHIIMRPLMVEEDMNLEFNEDDDYEHVLPEVVDPKDLKVWQAVMHLKDLYLECGWDVNAAKQTTFRRDEFLDKRRRYLLDVVQPLEASDDDA